MFAAGLAIATLQASLGSVLLVRVTPHPADTVNRIAFSPAQNENNVYIRCMKRLTTSPDRIIQVLNAVANGITVQEPGGRLVFVNPSAARMMDCRTPEEAIELGGVGIMAKFKFYNTHGIEISAQDLPGRKALRGVPEPRMTVSFSPRSHPDEIRWTTIKALPVKDEEGNVVLSVNVLEDITAQKRVERQLKEANARITNLLEQTLSR